MVSSVPILVTTHWLKEKLVERDGIVLLDCLWTPFQDSHENYKKLEHIPGAQHFDVKKCVTSTPLLPYNIPETTAFQHYVQSLGIHNDSHVIVYNRDDMNDLDTATLASARVWWLFRAMGHERISVLDGGLVKWQRDGYTVTREQTPITAKGNFKVNFSTALALSFEALLSALDVGGNQIVDCRLSPNFFEQEKEPSLFTQLGLKEANFPPLSADQIKGGHMPGAVNIPFLHFYSTETNCLHAPDTIKKNILRCWYRPGETTDCHLLRWIYCLLRSLGRCCMRQNRRVCILWFMDGVWSKSSNIFVCTK